jgi:D-amino-acid dehydrogenase
MEIRNYEPDVTLIKISLLAALRGSLDTSPRKHRALSHRILFLSHVHVAIVGAGIVGLATAYHLLKDGRRVTIVDRSPDGDKASFGNAGAIAVTEVVPASVPGVSIKVFRWMLDPLGPLAIRPAHAPKLVPWLRRFVRSSTSDEADRISGALAAINSRVYTDLLPMLLETGMASELRRNGALTLYETRKGYHRDEAEWVRKRALNIAVEELSGAEARQMEPALGPLVYRAMWTPEWSHVGDPKRLVQRLREWLRRRGVDVRTGEVSHISSVAGASLSLELAGGHRVLADQVVVAAGAWSAELARGLGDCALLESERGYNTTLPCPGVTITRELVFAERKFVASPLDCGLRIGGAAEFGGLNATPNFKRSRVLLQLAQRYIPALQISGGTVWAGHRPTTPDSLPVIGPSKHKENVFYAFGHGHLGLTQAATTGRLVSELIARSRPAIDMTPYGIERFCV